MSVQELVAERARLYNVHAEIQDKIDALNAMYTMAVNDSERTHLRAEMNTLLRDNIDSYVRETNVVTELCKRFVQVEMNMPLGTVTRNLEEETAKGTIRSYVNFLKNVAPDIQAKDVKARTTEEKVNLATHSKLKPYIPEFEKLYDEIVSIKEMREKEEHEEEHEEELDITER